MATIINFPVKHSNSYKNLVQFFELCQTVEECNFYLDTVEISASKGHISEKEMYTLRRIGRQKRIKLANPVQVPQEVTGAGTYLYTPEMGQEKPNCQLRASLSHYGNHYYIYTKLTLKGRGITQCDTSNNENCYRVTKKAYDKLSEQYSISYECNLD